MPGGDPFLDTNVLLYLLSGDTAKAGRAERLLADGAVISVQVLNEFASVAQRKAGLSIAEIREIVATFRATCDVRPLDVATHERGLEIAETHRLSLWDGLIVAAAELAGCPIVLSEDMGHGARIGAVTVRNPFRPR